MTCDLFNEIFYNDLHTFTGTGMKASDSSEVNFVLKYYIEINI